MKSPLPPDAAPGRGASPWTGAERRRLLAWEICWPLFCRWTPKPCWRWRNFWLRLFGARLGQRVFVHQRARIQVPWKIRLDDFACVGDRANLYSLAQISLGREATVAQEAYLCGGTHEFASPAMPLRTAPIVIEERAFVGARAFVMPGVTVGREAVVGACSVVTRDVPPGSTVSGSPARVHSRLS